MAYKTINDLDSIIGVLNTLSNQAQKKEQRRYSRDASQYDGYKNQIGNTFNTDRLNVVESDIRNYINQYGDRFSDISHENFSILLNDVENQRRDVQGYENDMKLANNWKDTFVRNIDEYRATNSNATGEIEYTPIGGTESMIVSNPGAFATYDGNIEEYNADIQQWEEAKGSKLNSIKENMMLDSTSYIKSIENIQNKYSHIIGHQSQAIEAQGLLNNNEVFEFGIQSIKDDFYMDDAEYDAYTDAIRSGSMQSINKYVKTEEAHNEALIGDTRERASDIFDTSNTNSEIIQRYEDFIETWSNPATRSQAEDMFSRQFAMDGDDVITYEQLIVNGAPSEEFEDMISGYRVQNYSDATKIKNLDKRYSRLTGKSLVDDYTFDDAALNNIAGFDSGKVKGKTYIETKEDARTRAHNRGEKTYQYDGKEFTIAGTSVTDDIPIVKEIAPTKIERIVGGKSLGETDNIVTADKLSGVGIIAVEEGTDGWGGGNLSALPDKPLESIQGLKDWQYKVAEKYSTDANKAIWEINNLLEAEVGVNMVEYEKDMVSYEQLKIDLAEAKEAFPYQSGMLFVDHPEIDAIQAAMNKLEKKWGAAERNEFYTTRKRINLLIERYGNASNNLDTFKSKIKSK